MAKKTYRNKDRNLDVLLKDIDTWFSEQGYQTQTNNADGTWFLQAKKTEAWRKVVGASRAFNVLIQGQPKDFSVELSTGEWRSNLAVVGVVSWFTFGLPLLATGIAAGWSKKIETDLWNFIDSKVMFGEKAKSAQDIAVIKSQNTSEEKLKQLENARDVGIITHEEFEKKKLALLV